MGIMKKTLLILTVFCAELLAQPTHIGKHLMGESLAKWNQLEPDVQTNLNLLGNHSTEGTETIDSWMAKFNIVLSDICKRHTTEKEFCKRLTEVKQLGGGDLVTANQYGATIKWSFSGGVLYSAHIKGLTIEENISLAQMQRDKNSKITYTADRVFYWAFQNDQLVEAMVIANHAGIRYDSEVSFLTVSYGSPSVHTKTFQNALGAVWERREAVWVTPDGTTIMASENSTFDKKEQLGSV